MLDTFEALAEAMNAYGPVAVLLAGLTAMNVFFIWQNHKREVSMQRQIDELHEAHNEIVLPLLTRCSEAIVSCKDALNQNSTIISGFLHHGR